MLLTLIKLAVTGAAIMLLYLIGASVVRNFAGGHAVIDEELTPLEDVDYRYRCIVCGTEVVMYASPDAEEPMPPRHCAERMALIAPVS